MTSERDGLDDKEIRRIFAFRNAAVVGASRDPSKPAHYVPKYLLDHGYKTIPVNPTANQILGRKNSASLADVAGQVDVVDISGHRTTYCRLYEKP